MFPPVRPVPATMPSTFESTVMFATFCWNTAPVARLGTPIFFRSSVKASIDTYTYSARPLDFLRSRK